MKPSFPSPGSWRDCIVILIDLIGIKALPSLKASNCMRGMHLDLRNWMQKEQESRIEHAYGWNDAILLLAHPAGISEYEAILREADDLKRQLDQRFGRSYAIAVKGKTFPAGGKNQDRVTIIEASSWALSNCFLIEEKARQKKWKMSWYIDSRIAKRIRTEANCRRRENVSLRPKNTFRAICLYNTCLWNGSKEGG